MDRRMRWVDGWVDGTKCGTGIEGGREGEGKMWGKFGTPTWEAGKFIHPHSTTCFTIDTTQCGAHIPPTPTAAHPATHFSAVRPRVKEQPPWKATPFLPSLPFLPPFALIEWERHTQGATVFIEWQLWHRVTGSRAWMDGSPFSRPIGWMCFGSQSPLVLFQMERRLRSNGAKVVLHNIPSARPSA